MGDSKVTKIRSLRHGVVLIQWADSKGLLQRGFVPESVADAPSKADLEGAAPFGDLVLSDLPRAVVAPAKVLEILRRQGVWHRSQISGAPHLLRDAYAKIISESLRSWKPAETDAGQERETEE